MAIQARVEGNLTKNPESRFVQVGGENRQIVELRVFSDVNRQVNGQWEQDDERSSGVDVTVWKERLGEGVLEHFKKGARVVVEGELHLNTYTDKDGVPRAALRMEGESVALLPYRLKAIDYAPKREHAPAA